MHWFWRATIAIAVTCVFAMVRPFPTSHPIPGVTLFLSTPAILGNLFANILGSNYEFIRQVIVFGSIAAMAIAVFGSLGWRFPVNRQSSETRCRKCGYILRGISEPRCPECGERI